MAKQRRRTAGRRKTDSKLPGWLYMLMGLAIGLAVAAGIYVSDRKQPLAPVASPAPEPAPEPKPEPVIIEDTDADDEVDFDFYEMLPNLDVEVYEEEQPAPPPAAPVVPSQPAPAQPEPLVQTPGIYILQAGSFSTLTDANRRKAEIALLGIRSEIKKGDANGRIVYRVYTDPLQTPDDVNRVSSLLNGAGIEVLRKRVK